MSILRYFDVYIQLKWLGGGQGETYLNIILVDTFNNEGLDTKI